MRRFKKLIGLLSIFVFLFSACNKKENLFNKESSNIKVENGYLSFVDNEQFERTLDSLNNLTEENYSAWEKNMGFKSKHSFIKNQVANEIEPEFKLLKRALVINSDGLLKISNNLFKFENDRVICVVDGNLSKLQQAVKLTQSDEKKGIFISSISTRALNENGATLLNGTSLLKSNSISFLCNTGIDVFSGYPRRYYMTNLVINTWLQAPTNGGNIIGFEVIIQGVSVKVTGGQMGFYQDLVLNISACDLTYHSVRPDQYFHFTGSNIIGYNWMLSKTIFSGSCFSTGEDLSRLGMVFTNLKYSFSSAMDGLICSN